MQGCVVEAEEPVLDEDEVGEEGVDEVEGCGNDRGECGSEVAVRDVEFLGWSVSGGVAFWGIRLVVLTSPARATSASALAKAASSLGVRGDLRCSLSAFSWACS